jgi:flagellar basal body-associated protein FliL
MKNKLFNTLSILIGVILITLVIILFTKVDRKITISEVSPAKESRNLLPSDEIRVNFQNLNSENKLAIRTRINPHTEFETKWDENTYVITNTEYWSPSTEYSLEFFTFNESIGTINFEVEEDQNLVEEEKIFILGVETEKAEQNRLEFIESYPWIDKFPVINDDYVAVFEYETISIRVRIKNSNSKNQEELNTLSKEIEDFFKEIGVDKSVDIEYVFD